MSTKGMHWKQHGKSNIQRFHEKYIVDPVTGCWNWTLGLDKDGYGKFKVDGKTVHAHRFSYTTFVGPVPKGKELHHTCENKKCCNWAHVQPETYFNHIVNLSPNAPAYKNARKTMCPHGHPLVGENLDPIELRVGHRACRTCRRKNNAATANRRRRRLGILAREPYKYKVAVRIYAPEDSQTIGGFQS